MEYQKITLSPEDQHFPSWILSPQATISRCVQEREHPCVAKGINPFVYLNLKAIYLILQKTKKCKVIYIFPSTLC